MRADYQSRLYQQLRGRIIDPHIKNVNPTTARKYKSVVLQRLGLTNREAAEALNHTEHVNTNDYSTPSTDEMKEELGAFWNAVKADASMLTIKKAKGGRQEKSTAVGHCDEMNDPRPLKTNTPITPNCKTQYGCLYCEHYICHADEEDIEKLLSLKYVLDAVRGMAEEYQRADNLFRGLCLRVEAVLARIENLYPDLTKRIEEIRKDVFELGLLTPFWELRLSRYEEMGIVL